MEEHDQRDAKRYTEEMVASENVFWGFFVLLFFGVFFWWLRNKYVFDLTKTNAVQFLKCRKFEFTMRKKQKLNVCTNRLITKKM